MVPGITFAKNQNEKVADELKWKKSPCRFCGVGCGLLIGIQDGKAVAVKGDPASSVNKGLCCVKGYHSVMALYGKDRLKKPLVKRNCCLFFCQMVLLFCELTRIFCLNSSF